MSKSKLNISLLVVSCDNYSDVWPIFFRNFFNYWNDCPININLLSNYKSFNHPQVNNINVGEDVSWSDNLLKGIKELNNDYILVILDDLLFKNKISNNYFDQISDWINKNKPNYLRLCISHKPEYFDDLIGSIPTITPYKTSTMPCIWKKSVLNDLLIKGESAWDFEIEGSKRAYKFDNFFAVYKNFITYENVIIKGKWQKSIIKRGNIYGLKINDISRPVMSSREQNTYLFRKFRSALFNKFPNRLRSLLRG